VLARYGPKKFTWILTAQYYT